MYSNIRSRHLAPLANLTSLDTEGGLPPCVSAIGLLLPVVTDRNGQFFADQGDKASWSSPM
jgi:hypothetical protein